jgi:hypothetical protein
VKDLPANRWLLNRITQTVENPSRTAPLANFGSRFGLR